MIDSESTENKLFFIQKCIRSRRILWTYHVNMRMADRFIARDIIIDSYESFKIIEEYSEDRLLPSCLVYGEKDSLVFHVVIAIDAKNEKIIVITAYRPDPDKWTNDFTRREK